MDPADRLSWEPGDAAQCDLWFPPRRIPLEDSTAAALLVFGLLISPPFLREIPLTGWVLAVLALVVARPLDSRHGIHRPRDAHGPAFRFPPASRLTGSPPAETGGHCRCDTRLAG